MKRFLMIIVLGLSILGLNKNVMAQGEAAVPFLLLAPDSRAGGLGESNAGLADNGSAIFWNPAGIAFLSGSEVSITHSNWLPQFNLDLFYDYLTYRQYVPSIGGSITSSITFMNFGKFVRTNDQGDITGDFSSYDAAFTIGYATKIASDWGLGFNFRLIHSRLAPSGAGVEEGEGVATSVSFDIAGMWRPEHLNIPLIGDFGNRLSIGLNVSNLGPSIYYIDQAQSDPIPTNFRAGFAFRLLESEDNNLTYTLDFSRLLIHRDSGSDTTADGKSTFERDEWYKAVFSSWGNPNMWREFVTSMGLEYWYGVPGDFQFALRTGFFYEDPSYGNRKFITLGAGLKYDLYSFDFSYITTDVFKDGENHPLSNTLRFSLMIGWGAEQETMMGFPRGL